MPRGNYCVKSSRKGRAKNVVEPVWLSLLGSGYSAAIILSGGFPII